MPELVEVAFKGNRKDYFSWDAKGQIAVGDPVVVSLERGKDFGRVTAVGEVAERKCGVGCSGCALTEAKKPSGKVIRRATDDDTHLSNELRKAEEDIRRKVLERVQAHELVMKVSDAEWQWDRKKLTVYFTAEKRVDFRALVRDLASLFRTRIELRQIGARDEAKRLDGIGRCGRQYCCSSWLPELKPVSLSLAKDQRLSLNPAQISGGCGRLLCCLRYEHEFYVTSRRRFPKEGKTVRTRDGTFSVQAIDIFRELILLRGEDGTTRSVPLSVLKQAVRTTPRAPRAEAPSPPGSLITFDEGQAPVAPEQTAEAAGPPKGRRRRRRRRRRGKGDGESGGDGGSGGSPEAPGGG